MREYLRSLRIANNMSQSEIADRINISQQYYSLIETGKRIKSLSVDIVNKFSEVFNISVEEILEYENNWHSFSE